MTFLNNILVWIKFDFSDFQKAILHIAIESNNIEFVKFLLQFNNIDVNKCRKIF